MERSQSVPVKGSGPGGAVVQSNPFWSDKVKGDLEIRAARPRELPRTPVEVEVEGMTVERPTGVKPGKGRGGQPTGAGRGCYVTPPSNWQSSEPNSAVPLEGNRTEGVMPPSGDRFFLKSMGRIPVDDDELPPGDLQRALEAEIVNHLRTQNTQLMDELERLRNMQSQQGSASNSSWTEVGKESVSVGRGREELRGRTGYHTPRSSTKPDMGKLDSRFTPNGTKVPDGTPPNDDQHVPRPPPALLSVPPLPPSFMDENDMKRFLDEYEPVETKSKVLKVDKQWEPTKEMTPHEARAFWLEKEVVSLKQSLAKMSGGNSFQNSSYWSNGFQPPPPGPSTVPWTCDGPAQLAPPDPVLAERISRAYPGDAGLGAHHEQDRAGSSSMRPEHLRGHLLASDGADPLHSRACMGSMGPGHLQGHLLGHCDANHLHDRACSALSSSRPVMALIYHTKLGLCMAWGGALGYVTTVQDASKIFLGLVWGEVEWEKDQWTGFMVLGRGQKGVQ
eukprot:s1132_g11.t1